MEGYNHWNEESRFESIMREKSGLFVGKQNVEMHSADPSHRKELYFKVLSWFGETANRMEPSHHLCVPSP